MKLPSPAKLDLASQLSEFDIWITPSLGEIRDTERFRKELQQVANVFESLGKETNGFASVDTCSPEAVTTALLKLVEGRPEEEAAAQLEGAASVLFLATGKSDNNAKCQLPLYLRDKARWLAFPAIKKQGRTSVLSNVTLPRVLRADDFMSVVASLSGHTEEQKRLLQEFVTFLLSDKDYVAQLWTIGHSYWKLKDVNREQALLTPLVIFQVRGSVSASGGHAPEDRLRQRFDEWGLIRGVDYNTSDVVIEADKAGNGRTKTRAYDFVLPFSTSSWPRRIYIQSQFYAGDSGSVSHKNVDQTSTSRAKVLAKSKGARFVEYVDGAGYFSSLNGDLKTLLSMKNTLTFFQVRSAPIRLRRVLQGIGFLAPLELEHAVARTDGTIESARKLLLKEGYQAKEIQRCLTNCEGRYLDISGSQIAIKAERRELARRYLLLDVVACFGAVPANGGAKLTGYLLVPGFGPFYGMKLTELLSKATEVAPGFADELQTSKTMLADVQWLEEQQWIMSS
jgi:hypothetical protein